MNAPAQKNRCTKRAPCSNDQTDDNACVPLSLTHGYEQNPDVIFTYASGNQPDSLVCDGKKIDFGSDTTGGKNTPCVAAHHSDNVLCIGNVWDEKNDFENQGDYSTKLVAFGAPGKNILSTCPPAWTDRVADNMYVGGADNQLKDKEAYCYATGSSMSTPAVAGVNGMLMKLFQLKGKSDLMQGKIIADILMKSVTKVDSLAEKYMTGGYLNAGVAFEKAMAKVVDSHKSEVNTNDTIISVLTALSLNAKPQIASILEKAISQLMEPVPAPAVKSSIADVSAFKSSAQHSDTAPSDTFFQADFNDSELLIQI